MSEDCESLWMLYNVFMTPHSLCNFYKVKLTFGWFAHLHLLDRVAHRSKRPVPQELLAHHFSSDHCEGEGGRGERGGRSSVTLKRSQQTVRFLPENKAPPRPVGGISKARQKYHFRVGLAPQLILLSDFLHCCDVPGEANGQKRDMDFRV